MKKLIVFDYFYEDKSITTEEYNLSKYDNIAKLIDKYFSPEHNKIAILYYENNKYYYEFNPKIKNYLISNEIDDKKKELIYFKIKEIIENTYELKNFIIERLLSSKTNYFLIFKLYKSILVLNKNTKDYFIIDEKNIDFCINENEKNKIIPEFMHKCNSFNEIINKF